MITNYYYNQQIRSYIVQMINIFSGLEVRTGKGANGEVESIRVPVHYGSQDRVVAGIAVGFNQNKMYPVPMLSIYMTGIELTPERRKGVGQIDRTTFLPVGGQFPNDLKVAERLMPIPYNLTFDVHAFSSNTDQSLQISEQILMLFDPILQIQTSDKAFDWTKLTTIELTAVNNEESMPAGTDKRMLVWTYSFTVPIWLTPPMDIKNDYVNKIKFHIGTYDGTTALEVDEIGDLVPFEI